MTVTFHSRLIYKTERTAKYEMMMIPKSYTILLLAVGGFFTSSAGTPDFTGAWKGPKDLMINVCVDSQSQPYICHCGIFRTYGWVNFSTIVSTDSLIMVSRDEGSPSEGRFKIESDDRLTGILKMGGRGDEWYYNGKAELVRQKPIMPDKFSLQRRQGVSGNQDSSIKTIRNRLYFSVDGA